jgi:hypothetical protein
MKKFLLGLTLLTSMLTFAEIDCSIAIGDHKNGNSNISREFDLWVDLKAKLASLNYKLIDNEADAKFLVHIDEHHGIPLRLRDLGFIQYTTTIKIVNQKTGKIYSKEARVPTGAKVNFFMRRVLEQSTYSSAIKMLDLNCM